MMVLNILLAIHMMMIKLDLCVILPQMSGYIEYFDNGSKNT